MSSVGEAASPGDQDLVTVIVTCYNYGRYVESAIRSVFAQDYRPIELIVINDGSTDDSQAVIDRVLADAPDGVETHTVEHENRGVRTVRNEARGLAQGAFHIFLDADDTWDADFVSELHRVACAESADVVYPSWRVTEEDTGATWVRDFGPFSVEGIQMQDFDVCVSSLVRTDSVRGFETRIDDAGEDWDFFNRLVLSGLVFVHAPKAYLNYLTKPTGNNRQSSYVDNVLKYERLLDAWREEFGADRVIAPGRLAEKHFRHLEAAFDADHRRADVAEAELARTRAELDGVRTSVTFRVGSAIVSPLRKARNAAAALANRERPRG